MSMTATIQKQETKKHVHELYVKYYGNQPRVVNSIATEMKRFNTGPSRNEMMIEAKERGIKNFRILNKEELIKVLEMKKSGATDEQIKEQVVDSAVTRWKSGWKTAVVTAMILLIAVPVMAETASWYSVESCKREGTSGIMANGKELNDEAFTCASWDYSLGIYLQITNEANGKSVICVVSDRGPAKALYKRGRTIDLSKAAFRAIADLKQGIIEVQIEEL